MKYDARIRAAERAKDFQMMWYWEEVQRDHYALSDIGNAKYLEMIESCEDCAWDRRFRLGVRPCTFHRLARNQDGVMCYGWRDRP